MNQNMMLIALVVGALFFLRPPRATNPWWNPSGRSTYIGRVGYGQMTGGAGTGYGVDQWGDEG